MPKTSKVIDRTAARGTIRGLKKRFSPQSPVKVGGKLHSRAQALAVYEEYLGAGDAVVAARAALSVAIAREGAATRAMKAFSLLLKATVASLFGRTSEAYADFGWRVPKKTGPKTLQGKVEGARKAKATREARGTGRRTG